MGKERLLVIPGYTGDETLDAVLKSPKSIHLLWLEILLNGEIDWERYLDHSEVRAAYEKACIWYTHFKTMVEGHTGRKPLEFKPGEIDMREHRRFMEALKFVSG